MSPTNPSIRRTGTQIILPPYSLPRAAWWLRGLGVLVLLGFCLILGFFYALFTPYLLPMFAVPIVVAMLLAIWAMPDTRRAPTKTMVFSFWAFIATTALWPKYLALNLPGLPWITFTRIISLPLIISMLMCFSVSAEVRGRVGAALRSTPLIWKFMVALVAIWFLSLVFSTKVDDSINKLVIALTNWLAIFFIAVYVFLKPGRVGQLAFFMAITAGCAGLIGIWEWRLGKLPWAGHIPEILQIDDPSVRLLLAGVARAAVGELRVQSIQTTPLGLGEYMALAMPFLLQFTFGNFKRYIRILAGCAIPVVIFVVLLTQARLGLGGCGLAFLLYVLVWALKRRTRRPGDMLASLVAYAYPVFFALAVAASVVIKPVHDKVWGGSAQDASDLTRQVQWHIGLPVVAKHPWGYGIGRGGETLGYRAANNVLTIDTHYLEILLELGVIGFCVYYGLFLVGIYYGGRYTLRFQEQHKDYDYLPAVTIALINFVIIKSVFSQNDNHPLIYMLLGMVVAIVYRMRKDAGDLPPEKARPGASSRAAYPALPSGPAAP